MRCIISTLFLSIRTYITSEFQALKRVPNGTTRCKRGIRGIYASASGCSKHRSCRLFLRQLARVSPRTRKIHPHSSFSQSVMWLLISTRFSSRALRDITINMSTQAETHAKISFRLEQVSEKCGNTYIYGTFRLFCNLLSQVFSSFWALYSKPLKRMIVLHRVRANDNSFRRGGPFYIFAR